jgi:hypothetical protein
MGLEICQSVKNHVAIILGLGFRNMSECRNHMKIILGLGFRNMSECKKSYENHIRFRVYKYVRV